MRRTPANAGTEIAGWAIPGDGGQWFASLQGKNRNLPLLNPGLPHVEPHVTAWAQKVGLLSAESAEQARRERHIAFAGRVWPWAPDRKSVV